VDTFHVPSGVRDKTNPKQYKKHSLPTEETCVPADAEGKRSHSGWEFHCKGWIGDGNAHRSGASRDDMFPDSRKGSLDVDVLRKLGMTKSRMDEKDALFLFHLVMLICNPALSGIKEDPQRAFYSDVETFSNLYALESGWGGSHGHTFKNVGLTELVHFDGAVVGDGIRGGSNGALRGLQRRDCCFD
jgi:hypothetical protein